MWYAIHETATGRLVSVGSVLGTVPEGHSLQEYQERPDQDADWDRSALTFVPRAQVAAVIPTVDFLRRFTVQERVAIRTSPDPVVHDFRHLLDLSERVNMAHPDTSNGIGYLVHVGLLTPERGQEILHG